MQKELNYRLAEEDYRNWIHWSLTENPQKNRKFMAVALFIGLSFFLLSSGYRAAEGDITKMVPNIVIMLIVAGVLLVGMSQKHQEKLIWKRSGLQRLKMRDEFPTVHLVAEEGLLRIDARGAEDDERHTSFSYKEIFEIREIERLILLRTQKAWQFIAKSAFADDTEKDEFIRFLQEKIDDAAAHPENYPTEKEMEQAEKEAEAAKAAEERAARIAAGEILPEEEEDRDADAPQITRVDTSRMGSIGKLAHMVTADAGEESDDAEEAEGNGAPEETAVTEENSAPEEENAAAENSAE